MKRDELLGEIRADLHRLRAALDELEKKVVSLGDEPLETMEPEPVVIPMGSATGAREVAEEANDLFASPLSVLENSTPTEDTRPIDDTREHDELADLLGIGGMEQPEIAPAPDVFPAEAPASASAEHPFAGLASEEPMPREQTFENSADRSSDAASDAPSDEELMSMLESFSGKPGAARASEESAPGKEIPAAHPASKGEGERHKGGTKGSAGKFDLSVEEFEGILEKE